MAWLLLCLWALFLCSAGASWAAARLPARPHVRGRGGNRLRRRSVSPDELRRRRPARGGRAAGLPAGQQPLAASALPGEPPRARRSACRHCAQRYRGAAAAGVGACVLTGPPLGSRSRTTSAYSSNSSTPPAHPPSRCSRSVRNGTAHASQAHIPARAQAYALASGAYGAYSSTAQNRREWTSPETACRLTAFAVAATCAAGAVAQRVNVLVGPARSSECVAGGHVSSLFGVPMVSYSATSVDLSDKALYPNFCRGAHARARLWLRVVCVKESATGTSERGVRSGSHRPCPSMGRHQAHRLAGRRRAAAQRSAVQRNATQPVPLSRVISRRACETGLEEDRPRHNEARLLASHCAVPGGLTPPLLCAPRSDSYGLSITTHMQQAAVFFGVEIALQRTISPGVARGASGARRRSTVLVLTTNGAQSSSMRSRTSSPHGSALSSPTW
jgi:hypothetical protein